MSSKLASGIVGIVALLVVPKTALAYLDPGTGSMILQGLIALLGAFLATVGIYWRATKDFIRRILRPKSDAKSDYTGDP